MMTGIRDLIGQTLGGRYRIDEILGKGGMSAVYKAYDPNLRRTVAVKVIHTHLADDPKFITRFQEEAAAVAMLRHPNIVQVYDFDHDADELYYMVQEYIAGETLQDRLRRLNAAGQRMPVADAVRLTIQVANAAEYAHQRGMIHRDIKPANIMIDTSGQGILMDFGIVKIIGGARHTSTGVVVGTALYMAPETIHGRPPDLRSDVYSLGVTLFEMISGRPPFESDSAMAVMMMHINTPLPDLRQLRPDTPVELTRIVEKSLAKQSAERYETMGALVADLKTFVRGQQTGISPPNTLNLAVDTPPPSRVAPPGPNGSATVVEPPAAGASVRADKITAAALAGSMPPPTLVENFASAPAARPTVVEPLPAPAVSAASSDSTSTPRTPPPASQPSVAAPRRVAMPVLLVMLLVGLAVIGAAALFAFDRIANRFAATSAPGAPAAGTPAAGTPAAAALAGPTATPTTPAPVTAIAIATPAATSVQPSPTAPPPQPTEVALATPAAPTLIVPPAGVPFARIAGITLDNRGRYSVEYETFEFAEKLDDLHLVFFYNTQTTDLGYMYGGPRPFDRFAAAERPRLAHSLCIGVANPDHSIRPDSGACSLLPDITAVTAGQDLVCRQGPGLEFDSVAVLPALTPALALAISPDESWWQVVDPDDPSGACFVPISATRVDGDISTLPLAEFAPALPAQFVEITAIRLDAENRYVIDYITTGFTEQLPGVHIHFFFDTFSADQVGMSGGGNRLMYGGPSPFTGFRAVSRPPQASQICALVANPDHTIIPGSGNCFMLPDME